MIPSGYDSILSKPFGIRIQDRLPIKSRFVKSINKFFEGVRITQVNTLSVHGLYEVVLSSEIDNNIDIQIKVFSDLPESFRNVMSITESDKWIPTEMFRAHQITPDLSVLPFNFQYVLQAFARLVDKILINVLESYQIFIVFKNTCISVISVKVENSF